MRLCAVHAGLVVAFVALLLHPGAVAAICADKVASGAEQCDDGGLCIGGPLAGTACTSEAQCLSGGACFGGLDDLRACESDDDCRRGTCRRCRPVGGDGCAANCTLETDIVVDLVDGRFEGWGEIEFGTSGAVEFSPIITIPLPLSGSIGFTAGRNVEGMTPVVLRAGGIDLPRIPIATIACACVRLPSPSTCGGTLTDLDGKPSVNCTPGFPGMAACPASRPCAPLHGPGNAGSGFIGCGAPPVDIDLTHDCNATPGAEPLAPIQRSEVAGPGDVAEGNALLAFTAAIGTVVGACRGSAATYGADGEFCTEDDPIASHGEPVSTRFTTGSATGTILNPGDFDDVLGPFEARGRGFTCRTDGTVDLSHGIITTSFSACDQPTTSDIVVPASLAFQRAPALPEALAMPCAGDCDRLGDVTVDELVRIVAVALGTEVLSQCPMGDVDGDAEVTVDEVTAAVNRALHGCDSSLVEYECGNDFLDANEQCDDGGVCIGGPLAGARCTSEQGCRAGGACFGGLDDLRACESADDCRMGTCRRCRPTGGDGCAANCTMETEIALGLVPGVEDQHLRVVEFGTSGVGFFGPLFYFGAPIAGDMTLTTGEPIEGTTPLVIKAGDLILDRFPASTISCNCLRLPEASTCGGTAFELDGTPSSNCTAGFDGAHACPTDRPCAPVYGSGNGGSGFIGCGSAAVDTDVAQYCDGPQLRQPVVTTRSFEAGRANEGQALITLSPALASTSGLCTSTSTSTARGVDGEFCTRDDPISARGMPAALLFTTATATGTILEGFRGGPFEVEGAPFECRAETSVDLRTGGIASAFTTCDQPGIGATMVRPMSLFFAPRRPTPTATPTSTPRPGFGDCCECEEPVVCREPAARSCGECAVVRGAACVVGVGCRRHTPTPTHTRTRTRTITPTPTMSSIPTITRTPTPTSEPIRVVVGDALFAEAGSAAVVEVKLLDAGVADIENQIVFDNRVIIPTESGCQINPAIGSFPNGPAPAVTCSDDPGIGSCKSLSTTLQTCGSTPAPQGCPPGAGPQISVLTQTVVGREANVNEIPIGVLYTCELRLLDAGGLPVVLANRSVFAADGGGRLIPTIAVDGVARLGP